MNVREIKFRAWDARHQKFFIPADIANNIASSRPDGDKKLMQYTGLKDRNGKEIYEGDVVRWLVNDVVRVGIVDYPEDFGGYDMKNLDDEYHVCNDWMRGEYEVVGNIYENPELLTK